MSKIDLSYLNEISGGDQDFINELVQTFLVETPKDLSKIEAFRDEQNWLELGKVAHKIKSSIKLFGLEDLRDQVVYIEKNCKDQTNLDTIAPKVDQMVQDCNEAMEEMKKLI